MIIIVAKTKFKEDALDTLLPLLEELIAKSRAEEGCITYDLYQDIDTPTVLTFIEEWKDQEAIDLHNSSEHFTRIIPKLGSYAEEKEVNLYRQFR